MPDSEKCSVLGAIPARWGSTRFPGKPLELIAGKPLVQHVWERCSECSSLTDVVVATDDARIFEVVEAFGGKAVMTRDDHPSGTDRMAEVAEAFPDHDVLINIQGDEPLIPPRVIDQVASNLAANEQAGVATLCEPIESVEDFCNPNVVKVVTDVQGLARYFSRAPIPWPRDHFQESQNSMPDLDLARRHIGIYAYRVAELTRFVSWAVAPIERSESLEQLRFIWNSVGIHIADAIEPVPGGIDTEQDLESAIKIIKSL